MSKPRIGITRKGGTLSKTQETNHARYRARVEECGGYPVDLSPAAQASFKSVQQDGIQGVLFTGGGDLDPLLYGEQNRASHFIDAESRSHMTLDDINLQFGANAPMPQNTSVGPKCGSPQLIPSCGPHLRLFPCAVHYFWPQLSA